ncbi:MAG: hypothetical protein LBU15_03240 [Rickettsiales bacterium]|jgi:hypothetical protein|nr:hypothetical protein [Rickettsiales bacterium]
MRRSWKKDWRMNRGSLETERGNQRASGGRGGRGVENSEYSLAKYIYRYNNYRSHLKLDGTAAN